MVRAEFKTLFLSLMKKDISKGEVHGEIMWPDQVRSHSNPCKYYGVCTEDSFKQLLGWYQAP